MSAKQEQDWEFDKDKASKALQTLSCHVNPFRDENVAELVRVITYCMDLEKALDKACKQLTHAYPFGVNKCETDAWDDSWKEWAFKNDER